MKCRKGDSVLLKNGKWCYVIKGTNLENGDVKVTERFPELNWTQKTYHRASEIVELKKGRRGCSTYKKGTR